MNAAVTKRIIESHREPEAYISHDAPPHTHDRPFLRAVVPAKTRILFFGT
jgi:hypothetical protein